MAVHVQATVQVDRLRKEIEWAAGEATKIVGVIDPEDGRTYFYRWGEWLQSAWICERRPEALAEAAKHGVTACGTACCIAGHTVITEGLPLRRVGWQSYLADGQAIERVARGILGLNEGQAERLFHAGNEIKDLYRVANDITEGEIEIPVEHQ